MISEIQTPTGSIALKKTDLLRLRRLQKIIRFGILPLKEALNGAEYGLVMQCGDQEQFCLKQQPLEREREEAERLFRMQRVMIIEAYTNYIKLGFAGAYLATPYLRQRDNGLWESGVAHFVFPAASSTEDASQQELIGFDHHFGAGATDMLFGFIDCYKQAFADVAIPMPRYFGSDVRSRSHLNFIGMYFMALGSDLYCLRPNLHEMNDIAWPMLSKGGIKEVYYLPTLPVTIYESNLKKAKGLL